MDGSTIAAFQSFFMTNTVVQVLSFDQEAKESFTNCRLAVNRLEKKGIFKKSWILFPLHLKHHFVFLAVLNLSYLETSQEEKFTGYFMYDPTRYDLTRDDEMKIMSEKGILNFIIYANMKHGHPRRRGSEKEPLKVFIDSPNHFPSIKIPIDDFINQIDGYNCGVFTAITILEFSLLHARKYQKKEDFDEIDFFGTPAYALQKGDFYNCSPIQNQQRNRKRKKRRNNQTYSMEK
jgi:hypothetical protein